MGENYIRFHRPLALTKPAKPQSNASMWLPLGGHPTASNGPDARRGRALEGTRLRKHTSIRSAQSRVKQTFLSVSAEKGAGPRKLCTPIVTDRFRRADLIGHHNNNFTRQCDNKLTLWRYLWEANATPVLMGVLIFF